MKNVAIFFDRDGVINKDQGHTHKIGDFTFYKDVFQSIKLLTREYKIIIITNQAGIAKGYYTEKEYKILTKHMLKELRNQRIKIADVFHCPHHPNGTVKELKKRCECRKPEIGMINAAKQAHKLDLANSWLIGDKETDIEAGKKAKCKTILLNRSTKSSKKTKADYQVRTLKQATIIINKHHHER